MEYLSVMTSKIYLLVVIVFKLWLSQSSTKVLSYNTLRSKDNYSILDFIVFVAIIAFVNVVSIVAFSVFYVYIF